MKNVYLINETLIFEPELRRLGPLAEYPRRAATLHGPVSECLLQLLEHNQQVLTQRFLFTSVWEKHGAVVTTNALYQTIASIRKALKSAGLEENIIKTIPKEGFKSVAQVRTGELATFVISHKTAIYEDSPAVSTELEGAGLTTSEVTQNTALRSRIAYWIAAVLFLISCGVLFSAIQTDEPIFANYQHVGKRNGCEIYSSWQDKAQSLNKFMTLSSRYPIQCQAGGMVWMSLNHSQLGSSVFICDRHPDERGAQCDSIFYRQKYYEN
ncbi:MAG: winged helix-turn-helix domain-containing protein [Enterobacter sp.]|jgi:DNA-binding winged helix-turn-helix (wHTH) protein|nr:winged helix-turn-helix domain-containing protein [Enterobacter sp.]